MSDLVYILVLSRTVKPYISGLHYNQPQNAKRAPNDVHHRFNDDFESGKQL